MSLQSTPPGERVATRRLETFVRIAGPEDAPPLVLLHGNVSSSIFWSETIAAMAADHRVIAPDLRGFGDTERAAVDATRGLRDFTDDLEALLATLGVDGKPVHMVGWSLGGSAAMRYAIDHPQAIASLTLIAPARPTASAGPRAATAPPATPTTPAPGRG